MQDGRIYIELINRPLLFREGATQAEHKAGLNRAIERADWCFTNPEPM